MIGLCMGFLSLKINKKYTIGRKWGRGGGGGALEWYGRLGGVPGAIQQLRGLGERFRESGSSFSTFNWPPNDLSNSTVRL